MDTKLAAMRAIDAYDRIGVLGVFDRLTAGRTDESGAFTQGVGATNGQAMIVCGLLARHVGERLVTIEFLERAVINQETQETAWDRLIAMDTNSDNTWNNSKRPANIAFVLDDIGRLLLGIDSIPEGLSWLCFYVSTISKATGGA